MNDPESRRIQEEIKNKTTSRKINQKTRRNKKRLEYAELRSDV